MKSPLLFRMGLLARKTAGLAAVIVVVGTVSACTAGVSVPASNGTGSGGSTSGGGGGDTPVNPGTVTVPPAPFEPITAQASVRKVKNLLTGLPPVDEDVAAVTATGAAGLQSLINAWMTKPEFQEAFREKMLFFFRNAFQQTGFNPAEDFKPQLLTNGGFDFAATPGDDIFARLVQNLEDSFALTAWRLLLEGRPFSEVLTTRRFMMTTALKATYLQIEMPRDTRGTAAPTIAWKVDESGIDIPIEEIVDPASPHYLTFADVAPTATARVPALPCRGTAGLVNPFTGFSTLFQVLLGLIPQYSMTTAGVSTTICDRHASRPYFTVSDVSDWQWVTIRPLNPDETRLMPYDLPALRKTTELAVALPRIGFFTTPAFLALWNTNDSNQHRVTANQTLLVAFGQSFIPSSAIIPLSAAGLDSNHAVTGSECYACHKSLDPMRQFWASQFDFNDRNDFPARAAFGLAANPRPATTGGGFAFGNMNVTAANMFEFAPLLAQVTDSSDPNQPVSRFALATVQKLCFFANSAECLEGDPEFRRIAHAFESNNFNFASLLKELLSSPLVTGAKPTLTTPLPPVSIARRDQLCTSLSIRLGKPDLCGLNVAVPSATQAGTLKIATSIPADSFSRGGEFPLTAADPTLFYAAASEMLCENIAAQVVDAAAGDSVFSGTDPPTAIAQMVQKVMGYPPSDPLFPGAVAILQADYTANLAKLGTRPNVTTALRSTFALACQSPTSISFGL